MTAPPVSCQQARFCRCGQADCPGAPRNRARALVVYARWRNQDAVRLHRSRDHWAAAQRAVALAARDSLIAQARHLLAEAEPPPPSVRQRINAFELEHPAAFLAVLILGCAVVLGTAIFTTGAFA